MRKSLVYIAVAVFFLSCASAPKETVNVDKPSSGGEGIRIAVLQPKGVNIPEDQEWFLAMVQSSLTGDFNRFSKMTVLDRQHLDAILEEQKLSMSGNFSEADYIKIGNLTNAQYIIIGSLTKTAQNRFMLEMAITNPETGERRASFGPKEYKTPEIQRIVAAKDAAYELLTQVGVEFSPVDKQGLYEMTQSAVSAEAALSKGIVAEKRGATLVEVMQYYYQAVDYDVGMTEAINRLAETNGRLVNLSQPLSYVPTGNIREDAQAKIAAYRIEQENKRIDEENKQVWIKQLTDCENYFAAFFKTANAPLELIYSTDIQPLGDPDPINETLSLYFQVVFNPLQSSWFKAAEQTIASVRKGLIETGRAVDWGLSEWPKQKVSDISPFNNERRDYNITAILLDEQDTIISTAQFALSGGWECFISSKKEVVFQVSYEPTVKEVVFSDVKIESITDILSIRFSSINDIDIETATDNGILAITPDNQQIKKIYKTEQSKNAWNKWKKGRDVKFRFLLGYVYTPDLPIGLFFGGTGNQFGGYFLVHFGLDPHSDSMTINNPSHILPLDTQEERLMSVMFGLSYRIANNFFVNIGFGSYTTQIYKLFYVEGKDSPSWYIDIDDEDKGLSIGFVFEAGLMYSFKWFYLSAGYRQYSYTPSFYAGAGINLWY